MSSIIPAKDVAGLILKDIQDFVRKELDADDEDDEFDNDRDD